jgi:FkbM family methyltransferase
VTTATGRARPAVSSGAALRSFRDTTTRILRHPANRGRRGRALALYVCWQVWQRTVRRPWTIRLGDSMRIRLHPHSVVAAFVLYYRVHDYEDLSFVRTYLRPGDLFVDVGANVGVYSLWAAETQDVQVVAFEPSSATCALAVENVGLNRLEDRVRVVRKAVGAEVGEVRLTVGRDAMNQVTGRDGGDSEMVDQVTLDAELAGLAPALVKVDVEGGELDVLRGARQTILRHLPALIVEANDPPGLADELDQLGYTTWAYDPDRRRLVPATPEQGANVLALADVDAARARVEAPLSTVAGRLPADRSRLPASWKLLMLQRVPLVRLLLLRRDFLLPSGWLESWRRNVPVAQDGSPLPWYTYSMIDFIEGRIRPDMEVFEYGAGNSTLWWAQRVAHVSAVESDEGWARRLAADLPANVDLRFEPAEAPGYAGSAAARARAFDIVVIDGMERNACAAAALPALKEDGVVIWDNSDWADAWADGIDHLVAAGFRRIDLRGLGPLVWRPWTTSVFYRPGRNCLGL